MQCLKESFNFIEQVASTAHMSLVIGVGGVLFSSYIYSLSNLSFQVPWVPYYIFLWDDYVMKRWERVEGLFYIINKRIISLVNF